MKNLGTMNGWTEKPVEYVNHINNCGTEYDVTIAYMEKNPSGV